MAKGNSVTKHEPQQSTAVAVGGTQSGVLARLAAAGIQATVAKRVTMPVLKLEPEQTRVVRCLSEIFESTYAEEAKPGDTAKKKKAQLFDAADIETGETGRIVCNVVLEKNLREAYPDGGITGKVFAITKKMNRPGKSYKDFEIMELSVPETITAAA